MKCMVKRYVTAQQRKNDDTSVTEDDVNEIKTEVSSFKYQLFDVLSKNGWKTEGVHTEDSGSQKQSTSYFNLENKTKNKITMNNYGRFVIFKEKLMILVVRLCVIF
jgi:hypothetical protein